MSDERRPPGDIRVFLAPTMEAATLSELLHEEGAVIGTDRLDILAGQISGLQERIDTMQAEINELKGVEPAAAAPDPQAAAAPQRQRQRPQ